MNELTAAADLGYGLIAFLLPGTLLAGGLLLAQMLLGRFASPGAWKALWLLLALKLIIPLGFWNPAAGLLGLLESHAWEDFSPDALTEGGQSEATEAAVLHLPVLPLADPEGASQAWLKEFPKPSLLSPPAGNQLSLAVSVVYLAGLVISLSFFGSRFLSARFLVRQARRSPSGRGREILEECRKLLAYRRPVALLGSELCPGPASWGLFRPVIIMPPALAERLGEEELKGVFLHELAHLKARDPGLLLLVDLLASLFWFHPAFWILKRRLRLTLELAADDRSLRAGAPAPQDYGRTLLAVLSLQAEGPLLQGARALVGGGAQLKTRLAHIRDFRPKGSGRGGALGVAALFLALLASRSSGEPSRMPPVYFDRVGFYRYADVLMEELQWDKAAQVFGALLVMDGRESSASANLARIRLMQGRPEDARAALAAGDMRSAWAWYCRARLLDERGERAAAVAEYRALLGFPHPGEAIYRLALAGLVRPLESPKIWPFALPAGREISGIEKRIALATGSWRASGSQTHGGHPVAAALDGDPRTRWSTRQAMAAGDTFELDLGSPRLLEAILAVDDAGGESIFTSDYPRDWSIQVSLDGQAWDQVASGAGVPDVYAGARFEARPVRYIRMVQGGKGVEELWSLYELRLWE